MAKYSFEYKKKIVQEYLTGNCGYVYLAKKYDVPAISDIKKWVENYKAFGDEGLLRSRKNQTYSFDFKYHVVKLYLSSEISYRKLALSQGITNPALLTRWVNDFRIAGPDALRPRKKDCKKALNLNNKKRRAASVPDNSIVDTRVEHVEQLEDELLKLRSEKIKGYLAG